MKHVFYKNVSHVWSHFRSFFHLEDTVALPTGIVFVRMNPAATVWISPGAQDVPFITMDKTVDCHSAHISSAADIQQHLV